MLKPAIRVLFLFFYMNSVVNLVIILSASILGASGINYILNTIGIKYNNKKNPEEYLQEDQPLQKFAENDLESQSIENINNPVSRES